MSSLDGQTALAETAMPHSRIAAITLDERTVIRRNQAIEHERAVAIADLLHENRFEPCNGPLGPYSIHLSVQENRLQIDVTGADAASERVILPLPAFRGIIKDYFLICESYYEAVNESNPARIEAIDMGRRGLHDEAAALLRDRLSGRIETDHATARRLFTLICVLHIR